jgi:hypothetical protein
VRDDKTLVRLGQAIGPEVVRRLHGRIVESAQAKRVTQGRKLRVNVNYPTDSTLLGDGARVLTRTMKKVATTRKCRVKSKLRDRMRSVNRRVMEAEGQIVTAYEVFEKRPWDSDLLIPAVEAHRQRFGRAPRVWDELQGGQLRGPAKDHREAHGSQAERNQGEAAPAPKRIHRGHPEVAAVCGEGVFPLPRHPGQRTPTVGVAEDVLRQWLRQQRSRWTWERFRERLAVHMPFVQVEHPYPNVRFDAKHPRYEPCAICGLQKYVRSAGNMH